MHGMILPYLNEIMQNQKGVMYEKKSIKRERLG